MRIKEHELGDASILPTIPLSDGSATATLQRCNADVTLFKGWLTASAQA
jgi:hypothetical protein